jgi:hypothetical protein
VGTSWFFRKTSDKTSGEPFVKQDGSRAQSSVPDDINDEIIEDAVNNVVYVEPSTPEESKMWPRGQLVE